MEKHKMDLKETIGNYVVSTVTLPKSYNDLGLGTYESMIINNGKFMDYQQRYDTEEEAIVGHHEIVMKIHQDILGDYI